MDAMKSQTLTRAELFEDVHNELGLPRQECAAIVERTLSEPEPPRP